MDTGPARHRAARRRRTGPLVAWALATLGGLLVAGTTKIGPVVLSITTNHGVHAGDLVGFGVCYGGVLLGTLLRPSRRPPRAPVPAQRARPNGAAAQPGWPNGAFTQRGGAGVAGYFPDGPTVSLRPDEDATRPLHLVHAPWPADPGRRRPGPPPRRA